MAEKERSGPPPLEDRPDQLPPLMVAALRYARAGWPVFPCASGDKTPLTHNGFKNATTDEATITAWWSRSPRANVAIATGAPGPDVVDFDVKNGAPGRATYTTLRDAGLLVGSHATVTTPSGGFHAYYLGSDQGNGSLARHGVDFRGRGGYVLAPPSVVGGAAYTLSSRRDRADSRPVDFAAIRRHLNPPSEIPRTVHLGTGGDYSALVAHVARAPENNRNNCLYWAARRAVETGADDQVFADMIDAAVSTGLAESEAVRTVSSAQRGVRR